MPKAIVIGLDGATFDLMTPWMDEGRLPILNQLQQHGSSGILRSTIPPYSAPAWTSIITGVNPGRHGIYDFFRTDSLTYKLVNSRQRKAPALWNYLTKMGKKSLVINVPGTYPPDEISGVMISGLLAPSKRSNFTFPISLKQRLTKDDLGLFEFEQVAVDDLPKSLAARYAPDKLVDMVNAATDSHATITKNLMRSFEWDFLMVVFRGIDDIQHLLWGNNAAILSCYQQADYWLGELIQSAPSSLIVIVSDHGFGPVKKYLYANNVLYNAGYLKTYSNPRNSGSLISMNLYEKFSRCFFFLVPLRKFLHTSAGQKIIRVSDEKRNINMNESKAVYHSVCSCGIRILPKNGFALEKKEFDEECQNIKNLFSNIIDPDTGQRVIHKIYSVSEAYSLNAVNSPLDLILEMEPGYGLQTILKQFGNKSENQQLPILSSPDFFSWAGDHRPEGIVFLSGPGIRSGQSLSASVLDIVPTILAWMQLSIPDIVEGRILNEAFHNPPNSKRINWEHFSSSDQLLTSKEQEKIKRLKEQF
jgi:predicted AlkP superfamily phosphohydrolase/phosphomutase